MGIFDSGFVDKLHVLNINGNSFKSMGQGWYSY